MHNFDPKNENLDLMVLVSPYVNKSMSFSLKFAIDREKTEIIAVKPSIGPRQGGFFVDLVLKNYPVLKLGNYDKNYRDISEPVQPWIVLDNVSSRLTVFHFNNLEKLSQNIVSTVQVSFYVPIDLNRRSGVFQALIGAEGYPGSTTFFNLTMTNAFSPKLLSLFPSSSSLNSKGMVTVVSVIIGNIFSVTRNDVMVESGGKSCDVIHVIYSSMQAQISFKLPLDTLPGLHSIQLRLSQFLLEPVQFDFFVFPPRELAALYVSNLNFMGNDALWRFENSRTTWTSAIKIAMIDPQEGPLSGGYVVTLNLHSNKNHFRINVSDIAVSVGKNLAEIVSLSMDRNGMSRINFILPPAHTPGRASSTVFLVADPSLADAFTFNYLPFNESSIPYIVSVLPTKGEHLAKIPVVMKVTLFV
jgi:hypothetical protein